jgi:2-polyprenyl-3-methyl-5-hydroxy-6-metoxy-1,4-benzoquinol methylase
MNCYLCGSSEYKNRPGKVRGLNDVSVFECLKCELVYLSSHDHIDESHYKNSGLHPENSPDINKWLEDTKRDDSRRFNFLKSKIKNKSVLDFGCGIGGFIEMAQKTASLANGIELEIALNDSFKERNLSVFSDLKTAIDSGLKWDLISAFHVVEHLTDPLSILKDLSLLLNKDGEIIIEVPNSEDALLKLYENKSFQNYVYWSEHVFVFSEKSVNTLIDKSDYKINWFEHIQRYPLSNHLYWLANGKPQGHEIWAFLNDNKLNQKYESLLKSKGLTDTIIFSIGLKD